MSTVCCVICRQEKSYKGIHTHYDRAHLKLTKYSDGNNKKQAEIGKKLKSKNKSNYLKNPKYCLHCESVIPYNKRENNFCNHSCSASFNNNKRDIKPGPKGKPKYTKIEWLVCPETGKYFCNRNSKGHIRSKSPYITQYKHRYGSKELFEYRQKCLFKFNVNDYPDQFDLSLIEKHGWYRPSNRGNNLFGVSRDHIVSVKYGFENNIDPEIISHPANCQLLIHSDNVSKSSQCDLTIEQLHENIRHWNRKYK